MSLRLVQGVMMPTGLSPFWKDFFAEWWREVDGHTDNHADEAPLPRAIAPVLDPPLPAVRRGYCARKFRYGTEVLAALVVARALESRGVRLAAYRCPACDGWHVSLARRAKPPDALRMLGCRP